jgi:hypothetical protein
MTSIGDEVDAFVAGWRKVQAFANVRGYLA